jgi:hypothetical protein
VASSGAWGLALCPGDEAVAPSGHSGEQGRQILPKAIGQKERRTVGRQYLRDVVDNAMCHRQGTIPDVDREQEFALGVYCAPDPLGRTLQTCDGFRAC